MKSLWLLTSTETAKILIPKFAAKNINVFHCPLINIAPIEVSLSALATLTKDSKTPNNIIFTSANAIVHGMPLVIAALKSANILPHQQNFPTAWLMGKSMEELTRQYFPHCKTPDSGHDSEALLATADWQTEAIRNTTVWLIKGKGGRNLLAATLEKRGAVVKTINSYQRLVNHSADIMIQNKLLSSSHCPPFGLVVLSKESLILLNKTLATIQQSTTNFDIKKLPLYVHHWRIRNLALECGFQYVVYANGILSLTEKIMERLKH